jgi:hypothetical protein
MRPLAPKMMVAFALAGFMSVEARAQEPKPEACFCLKRKDTGSTEHLGCKRKVPPNRFTPEIMCINTTAGSEYKVSSVAAFDEIVDGKDGCNPCRPEIVPGAHAEHPRGEEGQVK